ncbi:MAG: ATP-dependent zinc metalloprotease FtsH [Deltaproteobacteria bacterium]|nr:ATP-dependent zinc metalloprotease FtsH [Deltaproteobacteria bacterium]
MPVRSTVANILIILSIIGVLLLGAYAWETYAVPTVSQTAFIAMVEKGEVVEVTFSGNKVQGKRPGDDANAQARFVRTVSVPGDLALVDALKAKGVTYGATQPDGCESYMPLALLAVIASVMLFTSLGRGGGGEPNAARIARSQAKLAPEEGTGVTFKDVAGIDEAEEELNELVQFLKTPDRFTRLGGKIPKGVLLVGPPGTGKTLLARAVAGEAGVPFFSISGSDFMELYVGVGAARVRDLFKQAGERAPCIVFIDEIDAIGKARVAGMPGGGEGERDQTLNQLLVEMDGFDGRKGIILMAATNRPDTLDAALLRPGRFDRQVLVDRPDVRGREAILKVHASKIKLGTDVDLKRIAQLTPGFVGADLATALNEAALLAVRRDKEAVGQLEIEDAVERLALGLERRSRRLSDDERRLTAIHEAGHAIVSAGSPGGMPVQKVTIIPRGAGALGFTLYRADEERFTQSREQLVAMMVSAFGGRAAEELIFGHFNTGAANDIAQASDIARRMVTELGMSEVLGPINFAGERRNPFGFGGRTRDFEVSADTQKLIDGEVRKLIESAQDRARSLVKQNRDVLEEMAEALLKEETLSGDRLQDFLGKVRRLELAVG